MKRETLASKHKTRPASKLAWVSRLLRPSRLTRHLEACASIQSETKSLLNASGLIHVQPTYEKVAPDGECFLCFSVISVRFIWDEDEAQNPIPPPPPPLLRATSAGVEKKAPTTP